MQRIHGPDNVAPNPTVNELNDESTEVRNEPPLAPLKRRLDDSSHVEYPEAKRSLPNHDRCIAVPNKMVIELPDGDSNCSPSSDDRAYPIAGPSNLSVSSAGIASPVAGPGNLPVFSAGIASPGASFGNLSVSSAGIASPVAGPSNLSVSSAGSASPVAGPSNLSVSSAGSASPVAGPSNSHPETVIAHDPPPPGYHLICFNNASDLDEPDDVLSRVPGEVGPKLCQLVHSVQGEQLRVAPGMEMLADEHPLVDGLSEQQKIGARMILGILPDVDPTFVVRRMRQGQSADAIAEEIAAGQTNYPKLQPTATAAKQPVSAAPGRGLVFSVTELLRLYPDPELFFLDTAKRPAASNRYKREAFQQLTNLFPAFLLNEITRVQRKTNGFFLPAARQMRATLDRNAALLQPDQQCLQREKVFYDAWRLQAGVDRRCLRIFRKTSIRHKEQPRLISDDILFWEYNYYVNKDKVDERRRRPDQLKKEFLDNGGTLEECECCFLEDILPQQMVYCRDFIHAFCKDCVRSHATASIEQGKRVINCIYGSCQSSYSVPVLRRLMEPRLFEAFQRRISQFEVKQADLEDLVACPFCEFMVIMPNAADNVVKCLNPLCRKDSCRLCKQPEHVPYKCGELDATETGLRTFVENKMAEAMMRTCPNQKCGQKIIKVDGCNKMICPCGTMLCYVCNETLPKQNPYSHFNVPNSKCKLFSENVELHDRRAIEAGEAAMTEYLAKHPGLWQAMGGRRLDLKTLVGGSSRS